MKYDFFETHEQYMVTELNPNASFTTKGALADALRHHEEIGRK